MALIEIVDPRGKRAVNKINNGGCIWSNFLAGGRVGFFGNGKSNVKGFFDTWAGLILHEGTSNTFTIMKEGPMAAGNEEQYQRFKKQPIA